MPKIQLKIEIENPCSEDFDAMPLQGEGRYCAVCDKCVVDFTGKTDRELLEIYLKSSKPPCGMFREDQLNRKILLPQPAGNSGWRALVLAFGTLLTGNFAHAQQIKPWSKDYASARPVAQEGKYPLVRGAVTDRTGEPIAGVAIRYKGKNAVLAVSDIDGNFNFPLTEKKKPGRRLHLFFFKTGFLPTEKIILAEEIATVILEQMQPPLAPLACKLETDSLSPKKPKPKTKYYVRGIGISVPSYYVNGQKVPPPQAPKIPFKRQL